MQANHIALRTQCSCQIETLPLRHARRIPVAERQQLGRDVTESRLGHDLQPMVETRVAMFPWSTKDHPDGRSRLIALISADKSLR